MQRDRGVTSQQSLMYSYTKRDIIIRYWYSYVYVYVYVFLA